MSEILTREIVSGQSAFDQLQGEIAGTELHKLDEHDWAHACSMILALPGLRGFWPASAFDNTGALADMSGLGHTLALQGTPSFAYDGLVSYCGYDGTGDYHRLADHADYDVIGTETYVSSSLRGLTVGCWVSMSAFDVAASDGLVCKWLTTGNQRSWALFVSSPPGPAFSFSVSVDGTAVATVASTETPVAGTWYFVVGRFDPSTELNVWQNDVETVNAAAIPASIFNGTSFLEIASYDTGGACVHAIIALSWVCAELLSDDHILTLFYQTRHMFGV